MKINEIYLSNFRCYNSFKKTFLSDLTLFVGPNAAGKTTLIEAIYLLSLTKSPRAVIDKEMLKDGENNFFVEGRFVSSVNNKFHISYGYDGEKKVIKKNQMILKKSSDYVGTIDAVWFSANDLNLITGSPRERRSNFDRVICQISKVYFAALSNYKKFLKERNTLLKWLILENKPSNIILLETINQKLILEAKKIINIRKKIIDKLNSILSLKHKEISGTNEIIEIKYCPSSEEHSIEKDLLSRYNEDLKYGNTGVGPHKDDYIFIINNKNIATHGSQGQQRNAILSLKMSEVELIYEAKKEYPILLLDDVFSELDKNRQNKLIKGLKKEVQTFITTTSISEINDEVIAKAEIIHMKGDS